MKKVDFGRSLIISAGLAGLAAALADPALAQSAQFTLDPITINGSTAVNATAINDAGTIVGTVAGQGFVLAGGVVTLLPNPCQPSGGVTPPCSAVPTAVNGLGDVAGAYAVPFPYGDEAYSFVWRDGVYIAGLSVGITNSACAFSGPGLNNKDKIFYNLARCEQGAGPGAYAGVPPNVASLPATLSAPTIDTVNDHGVISGQTDFGVFEVVGSHVLKIKAPKGDSLRSGFVNDHDQLAGIMGTPKGLQGFVFAKNAFKTFSLPPSGAVAPQVLAFSNAGRVVGVYTAATDNLQHVFWYNGALVSTFGAFAAADTVHLALNAHGVLVVSDLTPAGATSYRVTCTGAGC